MADLGILRKCRPCRFTLKLHHLIDTVEFTIIRLLFGMRDVVIRPAEISITVISLLAARIRNISAVWGVSKFFLVWRR
jgi:hypothetical protein